MNYALITGASSGIGKAMAIYMAQKGCAVLLVARNELALQEIAQQITQQYNVNAHYLAIDLAEINAAEQIVYWCTQNNYVVNTLVNNAGYGLSGAWEKYSLQEHLANMQVNMNAVVALTYLFLPQLKKQPQAYILNIGSGASYQAVPGLNVYAATKAFVLNFSRGLSYELKDTNVFVTVACPGATDTGFATRANALSEKAQKLAKQFNMQPADVAKIAIEAMWKGKKEVIPGFMNKLTVFLVWLLPKRISEKMAADIYDL